MDIKTRAVVPMIPMTTDAKPFEVIIYGYSLFELMTVPNPVITSLARKYPDHASSPFLLRKGSTLFDPASLTPPENPVTPLVGFAALR